MGDPTAPVDSGANRSEINIWDRFLPVWHVIYALLLVLTAVVVVRDPDLTTGSRGMAVAAMALLGLWYATIGMKALPSDDHRLAVIYITGAVPLTIALFWFAPAGGLMLTMLYPHIWALLPERQAMVATALSAIGVVGAQLARGFTLADVESVVVPALLVLLIGPMLGVWIGRIIQQSHQRAELLAALEAARVELATVSHDAGVLAERERLSREIHDTLAQGFTSVLMLLQALESELDQDLDAARRHLGQAEQTVRENLAEARSLVALLTPTHLDAGSLPEVLERLAARFGRELGVTAAVTVTGQGRALPANHEVVLLRVTQEALANVRKHAAAGTVEVRLGYGDGRVRLEVGDDGRGFDPAAIPDGGFGLAGMRARVEQVDGTLGVESAPGQGTCVTVELPCADGAAAPAAPSAVGSGAPGARVSEVT